MRLALFFIASILLADTASAQVQQVFVTPDSLATGDRVIALLGEWRSQVGDDPAWAAADFDDSAWPSAVTTARGDAADDMAAATRWFRIDFEVAPKIRGKTLTALSWVLGPIDVYLNGEAVASYTKSDNVNRVFHEYPDIIVLNLSDAPRQTLAVRVHEQAQSPMLRGPMHLAGFALALSEPAFAPQFTARMVTKDVRERTFLGAMGFTIALIHLLLFVFYPRYMGNLFYALFTLSAAMLAYIPLRVKMATTMEELSMWIHSFNIILVAISLTGIRFLYAIFYEKMPRYFWIWAAIGLVMLAVFYHAPVQRIIIFTLLSLVEMTRVLVVALVKRKPGAWVVAVGSGAFIAASAGQMLMVLGVFPMVTDTAYLWGMLVMLLAMSIYLARGFAHISSNLEQEVERTKMLSARTLEHERVAKEQEMERIRLENENALKIKELEESRKRQQVLEELEQTHAELQSTQSQLVQSEKMAALGNLVAGVAHEINTPVGAITSMHDTMVRAVDKLKRTVKDTVPDRYDDPAFNRPFKVIEDANNVIQSGSTRVTDIVRRLRSFARLDEAELKRVDIHEGVEDTLMLIHHELKRDVTVTKNYGKIPHIACYPGQLNQVFLNLLVNARQAIADKGEITITTWPDGDSVKVRIGDSGAGIPPEKLNKIFDPGFTTKGVGVGTGLGLSICYQIVRAHHGTIEVESEIAKGSSFTITLPRNLDQIVES